jgi:hypothetical protein
MNLEIGGSATNFHRHDSGACMVRFAEWLLGIPQPTISCLHRSLPEKLHGSRWEAAAHLDDLEQLENGGETACYLVSPGI